MPWDVLNWFESIFGYVLNCWHCGARPLCLHKKCDMDNFDGGSKAQFSL